MNAVPIQLHPDVKRLLWHPWHAAPAHLDMGGHSAIAKLLADPLTKSTQRPSTGGQDHVFRDANGALNLVAHDGRHQHHFVGRV